MADPRKSATPTCCGTWPRRRSRSRRPRRIAARGRAAVLDGPPDPGAGRRRPGRVRGDDRARAGARAAEVAGDARRRGLAADRLGRDEQRRHRRRGRRRRRVAGGLRGASRQLAAPCACRPRTAARWPAPTGRWRCDAPARRRRPARPRPAAPSRSRGARGQRGRAASCADSMRRPSPGVIPDVTCVVGRMLDRMHRTLCLVIALVLGGCAGTSGGSLHVQPDPLRSQRRRVPAPGLLSRARAPAALAGRIVGTVYAGVFASSWSPPA